MEEKSNLYLATNGFPWGNGEKTFIMPELPYLLEQFDITILARVSNETGQEDETKLDESIKVLKYVARPLTGKEIVAGSIKAVLSLTMLREITEIICERKNIKVRIAESLSFYLHAQKYKKWLEKNRIIIPDKKAVFYSYWSDYFHMSAIMLKKKYPSLKVISRLHGMDLYNERHVGGRQPFKKIMDLKTEKLVFACEYGMKYYIRQFTDKKSKSKYEVCRLGTDEIKKVPSQLRHNSFCLVSCSNVIPLKRVEIIVDALSRIRDFNIKWVHFGDGESLEGIKKKASEKISDNITVQFVGHAENKKIREFYENNQVDCFITTSSTEGGCPVSITEAMSASIPVIGTCVGGITEMINGNGVLLPENPTIIEVEKAIREIYSLDDEQKQKMCNRSLEIWRQFFDERNNAQHIVKILKGVLR